MSLIKSAEHNYISQNKNRLRLCLALVLELGVYGPLVTVVTANRTQLHLTDKEHPIVLECGTLLLESD